METKEQLQSVQKLGDGDLICETCWREEYPDTPEPTYGWLVGRCDYCDRTTD